jgi:Mrp family chromosome partitioning ATPase
MPSKLNQLSIAANAAESFAVVKSPARSAELAAQEEELSSDVLQVAARLRASLTEERVLVVTGLAPDDRAHHFAKLLAIGLAQLSEEPVALVDADTQSPLLSRALASVEEPGFAELASGAATLEEVAVRRVSLPFIPSGVSSRVIGVPGCVRALNLLRKEYRYVVIASPCYQESPDAVTLASLSDGVVLAIGAGRRRRSEVQSFQRELARIRVRLLGSVLTEGRK